MNRLQLLLAKLAEEGSEISQIALKTQQFGLHEICPGLKFSNAQRTHQEIDDLMAIIEMLNEEFDFGYIPNRDNIDSKKLRVNEYAEKSINLGMVDNILETIDDRKEQSVFDILKYGTCQNCSNPGKEEHTCPFAEEIHNDYTECNCCDQCCHNCAMEI